MSHRFEKICLIILISLSCMSHTFHLRSCTVGRSPPLTRFTLHRSRSFPFCGIASKRSISFNAINGDQDRSDLSDSIVGEEQPSELASGDHRVQDTYKYDPPSSSNKVVEGGHVYFVATPLGNLGDITDRAKAILSNVDLILAEDTRNTAQLLRHLSLRYKGQLQSHHEHNQHQSLARIIDLVKRDKKSIAVVSDAGTPGISDPGSPLAAVLSKEDVPLHPIPGPSAVISALSVSGFPSSQFTFLGFPPVKGRERKEHLDQVIQTKHTVIIYEAPHRMLKTIREIEECGRGLGVGKRLMMCARELTKRHEELKRGTVTEILQWLESSEALKEGGQGAGIRGEFTVVFGPVTTDERDEQIARLRKSSRGELLFESSLSSGETEVVKLESDIGTTITSALLEYRKVGMKRSEAVKIVTKELSVPKSIVYNLALQVKDW